MKIRDIILESDEPIQVHKLEQLGLGKGPFKVIGLVQMPSPSLAEQNPAAYNAALRNLPKDVRCGTCAACGTAIKNNFIIKSADGQKHALGSECIKKVDDVRLTTQAKEVVRQQKREEKQAQWKAKADAREAELQAQKERNGGLTDYEVELKARKDAEAERMAPTIAKLAPLADALEDGKRGFRDSIASELRRGKLPSGRGLDIMMDILAKQGGRSGSAGYKQRWEELEQILSSIES